jgi:hypothetical protein
MCLWAARANDLWKMLKTSGSTQCMKIDNHECIPFFTCNQPTEPFPFLLIIGNWTPKPSGLDGKVQSQARCYWSLKLAPALSPHHSSRRGERRMYLQLSKENDLHRSSFF